MTSDNLIVIICQFILHKLVCYIFEYPILLFTFYSFNIYTLQSCAHSSTNGHLASSVNRVSKDSVAVSVVQALLSRKATDVIVSVAIVSGSSNLSQVSDFVKVGSGLVLLVARLSQGREVVEVKVAVDHVTLRGNSVCENAAATMVADITAVVGGNTTIGATALFGDLVKDVGNLSANAG